VLSVSFTVTMLLLVPSRQETYRNKLNRTYTFPSSKINTNMEDEAESDMVNLEEGSNHGDTDGRDASFERRRQQRLKRRKKVLQILLLRPQEQQLCVMPQFLFHLIDLFLDKVIECEALQLKLPTTEEDLQKVADGFRSISTSSDLFTGCVGAIDG
jgi:hypothetical protein